MNNSIQRKRKKPNGFFMFLLEFRQKLIENNHDIEDLNQIKDLAAPHWEKLSQAEKNKYKIKAEASDVSMDFNPKKKRDKFNCFGGNISEVERQKEIEQEKYSKMTADIKTLITEASDLGELDSSVMYFISTTSFFANNQEIYPAELAMAKFSLKEGVFENINIRINPGELPLGSASSAKEKADRAHRYPMPPNCEGETDYMEVLETMIEFLHPLDKLPIFFTEGNTRDDKTPLRETRQILHKIFYESQEDDMIRDLKIYPMEELLFMTQKVTVINRNRQNRTYDGQLLSIVNASNAFNNDDFMYLTKGCQFHHYKDAEQFCCLSKVRRYGFTIAKWCSDAKRYALKEGRHYPRR